MLYLRHSVGRLCAATICLFSLNSCVDSAYDLEKDINDNISFGGEYLALPLGTTDTIFLSKLIGTEEDEMLKADDDGNYSLSTSDQMNVSIPRIDPISFRRQTISLPEVALSITNIPPVTKALSAAGIALYAPISSSSTLTINQTIPKEIKGLKSVDFTNNPQITIAIGVSGSKELVTQMRLINLKITLPEFFVLKNPTNPTTPNQVIINDSFDPANGYDVTLEVDSFTFSNNPVVDAEIDLNSTISINGSLGIELNSIAGGVAPTDLKLTANTVINQMNAGVIEGLVDPKFNIDSQSVNFNDLPDFLKGEGVVLDVNPRVTLRVGNSIGIPVNISVQIDPILNENVIESAMTAVTLPVAAAVTNGVQTQSKFWISGTNTNVEQGYTYISAPNMINLVKQIPDRIEVKMKADVDQSQIHKIDLSIPEYNMAIAYNVDVPLSFGPELNIRYNDTVKNLSKNIGDYTDKVKELELSMDVKSAIPLNLLLAAKPLNRQGEAISGVSIIVVGDIAAGKVGGVTTSSLTLKVKETELGALRKLDAIVLDVSAKNSAAVENINLSEKQFMLLKMKLKIPGGVTVTNL